MDKTYNANVHLNSDECWMNSKDNNNSQLEKYAMYYNDSAKVDKKTGSLPNIALDHVNLHGRPGYGLSDDYLIDNYSALRNNKQSMTRDRCPIQLSSRTFKGGPKLTGKTGDIDRELDILSGTDTRTIPAIRSTPVFSNDNEKTESTTVFGNKIIMEQSMNNFMPLLDCVKEVQNPDNIVQSWTRGGEDTRSYVNKVKFNKCNINRKLI